MRSSLRILRPRLLPFRWLAGVLLLCFALMGGLSSRAIAEDVRPTPAVHETATSDDQGEDAFRHAAPVQWIAKQLHINVETAAKGIEDLNSGVLILVIVIFLVRKLPAAFRKRREEIGVALVDARSATEQANQRLTVVEERLSRLDSEIEGIRQQAERDAAQDEIRIKQSLEDERRRIVESAEQEITSAGVAAQRRLKQFAAELAIDRATRDLRLTPEADRLLVSDFGKQLSAELTSGQFKSGQGGRN